MMAVCDRLAHSLRTQKLSVANSGCVIDVEDLTKMITIEVFGFAGLGLDFGCTAELSNTKEVGDVNFLSNELGRRLSNPFRISNHFYNFPSKRNRLHSQSRTRLRTLVRRALKDRRQQVETENAQNDLIGAMLAALDPNKGSFKADEETDFERIISYMTVTLTFAGFEITSIVLTYALYLVSQHPEVERRCLEELEQTNPEDCVYCKGVIYEALRM